VDDFKRTKPFQIPVILAAACSDSLLKLDPSKKELYIGIMQCLDLYFVV
jgi:hypothetical protein